MRTPGDFDGCAAALICTLNASMHFVCKIKTLLKPIIQRALSRAVQQFSAREALGEEPDCGASGSVACALLYCA